MGTRSTITFISRYEDPESHRVMETPYVRIYQQYDGYPEGVGLELVDWLEKKNLVKWVSLYTDDIANGLGCLTAQYIRDHKPGPGDLYIEPLDTDLTYIDYNYEVIFDRNGDYVGCKHKSTDFITLRIYRYGGTTPFFIGKPEELREYIQRLEEVHG